MWFQVNRLEDIPMKDLNKTPESKSRDAADVSHQVNTTQLSLDDLSKVSGGQACVSGAHYKTVTLSMRKAGGDPN